MAGKVVDDGDRLPLGSIQSQDADLRIDRADPGDFLIGRHRIRVPNVDFLAVLQEQTSILHDAIFMPNTNPRLDRNQVVIGLLDGCNCAVGNIIANSAMTMTGIDQHMLRIDLQFFLQSGSDGPQVVIANWSDLTNGHGINRDQNGSV